MRVLLAVVALTMVCAPMALANGATQPVTPTTPPPVAPPPPEITPAQPGAGPAVVPMTGPVTMVPMMVPLLTNTCMLTKAPSTTSVTVLVPVSIDSATANKILSSRQVVMAMTTVNMPIVASQQIAGRAASGAGPCSVTIDQSTINRMTSSPNLMILPMMSPVALDQTMLNAIVCGQPVAISQETVSRLGGANGQAMIMPMTMSNPLMTTAGRGPQPMMTMSRDQMSRVLSSGMVLVPMTIDRSAVSTLVTNNSVMMVVPMMMPVASTMTSTCQP